MSHLSEVYAKDLGVKIGKPFFYPHFFPRSFNEYVTIYNNKSVQSNNYQLWSEVIEIVKEIYPEIKFLQISADKDNLIKNCDDFANTKSIKNDAFLIKNSLLHVGVDDQRSHIASFFDKNVVTIYGNRYPSVSKPIWNKHTRSINIDAFSQDNKPCFSDVDANKTINKIKPETIANSILNLLNQKSSTRNTFFIGKNIQSNIVEIVPDFAYDIVHSNISIRLDLCHNESNCYEILKRNHCLIVTNKPFNIDILKTNKIKQINYVSDQFDNRFITNVKKYGIPIVLICTDKNQLEKNRFTFFDEKIFLLDVSAKINQNKSKCELPSEDFFIKSNQKFIKNKQTFNSLYEANDKSNIDDLFLDLECFMLYTK